MVPYIIQIILKTWKGTLAPGTIHTYLKCKKIFFVDVDCEDASNYVNELFNKHDVNVDDLKRTGNVTGSISNINEINKFKYHIYFKNYLNIENNKLMDGLDLLTKGILFEDMKQFNKNTNLNELPELNINFYNDLLLYKQSKEEEKLKLILLILLLILIRILKMFIKY
jgi:hypothetical protein